MSPSTMMTTKPAVAQGLVACFKLLWTMGETGRVIWQASRQLETPRAQLLHCRRALSWLSRFKGQENRYKWLPVDVVTFIRSPDFLNMGEEVYPAIMDEIADLCFGDYVEAVFTGGIGSGKTSSALIVIAYHLYILSCFKSPHREFGLTVSSEIVFIFQSLKESAARGIDYMRFRSMLDNSPYFQTRFRYDHGITSELQFPHRIIVRPLSGDVNAAIGTNCYGGIIDECNFMSIVNKSSKSANGEVFDQANEMYNGIVRRRKSRFMSGGKLPGMLCLVSSKRYPGEFTDRKMEEAKSDPSIWVYDKRVWEVKPAGSFSGEWFRLFVGDATRKPRILDDDEEVDLEDRHLVMPIPREYMTEFNRDMLSALRDVAGVSTLALHPFIHDRDAVVECFGLTGNLFSRGDVDFQATKLVIYPKRIVNPAEPRFVHLDLALTGDSAGLAIGHVERFKDMRRGEREVETLPVVRFDGLLEIRPPRNGEIEFEKIRALLYRLCELGLPIRWVTADTFQSKDSLQILAQRGFITGEQSMDTSTHAYDVTKQAFYDRRIIAPEHDKAQTEFIRLERDPKTNKIDHPVQFSKDVSDAMAGVVFGLSMRREIWHRHRVPLSRVPPSLVARQAGKNSIDAREKAREAR